MTTMTSLKPKLIQVENGVEGKDYRTLKGIFKDDQPIVTLWRKTTNREVYVYVELIDELVALPHGYLLEELDIQPRGNPFFDQQMLTKFTTDHTDKSVVWLKSTSAAPIEKKEIPTMTDTNQAPAAPLKKKDVRAGYNAEILKYKQNREALSAKNVELKNQASTLKTRAERKPLNEQIKANVDLRAALSEQIKATLGKIQALRKEAPAA